MGPPHGVDGTAPAGWTRPRPGRPGLIRDACAGLGIALVIAGAHWAIVGSGILSDASDLSAHQPLWLRVVAPLAFGLVVAVRRRLPVTALIMGTAVFFGFVALGYLELFVTPFVYFYILYSAGAWSSRRTLVTVLRFPIATGVWASHPPHPGTPTHPATPPHPAPQPAVRQCCQTPLSRTNCSGIPMPPMRSGWAVHAVSPPSTGRITPLM